MHFSFSDHHGSHILSTIYVSNLFQFSDQKNFGLGTKCIMIDYRFQYRDQQVLADLNVIGGHHGILELVYALKVWYDDNLHQFYDPENQINMSALS